MVVCFNLREFSKTVFDPQPGTYAHEEPYRQGYAYRHILNLVGHVKTKRAEHHIEALRKIFQKHKHPNYYTPPKIELKGPAWADVGDTDDEDLEQHKGHPSAIPIAAALKSIVIAYEQQRGALTQSEIEYLTVARRQHGIIDKAFNVAIPYEHVLANRVAGSIQGGSSKNLARDLIEAAFYVARQRGSPLEQHFYFTPKFAYVDTDKTKRILKRLGYAAACCLITAARKFRWILPAALLGAAAYKVIKFAILLFRRYNTVEESLLSEKLYEHAKRINERRRRQRKQNNEHFLVRAARRKGKLAPAPIPECQLSEHSIDTVGPTSRLIGACYCCRQDATFHQEFRDFTGINPSFVIETTKAGFKATLEARVSEDPQDGPITTVGYGITIRAARDFALRDFVTVARGDNNALAPWFCRNCINAHEGNGPDTVGLYQRMSLEEYESCAQFDALCIYGAGFFEHAKEIEETSFGGKYVISKTVRKFQSTYCPKIADALELGDSPYVRPTGSEDETIGAFLANRAFLPKEEPTATCAAQNVTFLPMVIETTGAWSPEAARALGHISRAAGSPRSGATLLQEACVLVRSWRARAALRRRAASPLGHVAWLWPSELLQLRLLSAGLHS